MNKIIAILLMFVVSYNASAALITYNGYTLDDATNIVTGGGLEWLQWDETTGRTIDDALLNVASVFDGGGWRLASNSEIGGLLNAFAIGGLTNWDSDETTTQGDPDLFDGAEPDNDPEKIFVSIFGNTGTGSGILTTSDNPYELSAAYFGEDSDMDGLFNSVEVNDDYTRLFSPTLPPTLQNGLLFLGMDSSPTDLPNPLYGVALVRESQAGEPSTGVVSEPATGLLFTLALLMIALRNQKKEHAVNPLIDRILRAKMFI